MSDVSENSPLMSTGWVWDLICVGAGAMVSMAFGDTLVMFSAFEKCSVCDH